MKSRRAPVAGGRTVPLFVRVTAEEAAALQGMRVELGARSLQEVLVWRALHMPEGGASPQEWRELKAALFDLKRVLAGVARNVNQMAKAGNATGEVPWDQVEASLAWLEEMAGPGGRISAAIRELTSGGA